MRTRGEQSTPSPREYWARAHGSPVLKIILATCFERERERRPPFFFCSPPWSGCDLYAIRIDETPASVEMAREKARVSITDARPKCCNVGAFSGAAGRGRKDVVTGGGN